MDLKRLEKLIEKSWTKKTSASPQDWKYSNPAWGQCAITALVVQDFMGGELLRAVVPIDEKNSISHYWNLLPDGKETDFTFKQFSSETVLKNEEKRDRQYVLSYPDTRKRYVLLRLALENQLRKNPIFFNDIFKICFETALDSECQKMKFACLVFYKNSLVVKTANKTIGPLKELCQPECIRFKISSRTESMIGACGHAEEWAIWETINQKIPLNDCSFFIAGFNGKDNTPWIKSEAEHTCLRCAVQMYMAKIGRIYVPVNDEWGPTTPEMALKTSLAYAIKEKEIK